MRSDGQVRSAAVVGISGNHEDADTPPVVPPERRGLIVGLTGGLATGKSTVARMWRDRGARVISSDETVHCLLANDADVRREVVAAFGASVLDASGAVDRAVLGDMAFADERLRDRLTAILHPRTIAHHKREMLRLAEKAPRGVVVLDSPLLFEVLLDRSVDVTVVVGAPEEAQITRAVARSVESGRALTPDDVRRRIAAQMPLEEKRRRATFVIENDGSLSELEARATDVWCSLVALAAQADR
jgi:dephospho-CoA kinase